MEEALGCLLEPLAWMVVASLNSAKPAWERLCAAAFLVGAVLMLAAPFVGGRWAVAGLACWVSAGVVVWRNSSGGPPRRRGK